MATGGAFEAIVLGAGQGSRFGGGKLTAPWGGGVLLDGALAAAFAAPARGVIVTWGADAAVPQVAEAFANRIGAGERLTVVHAPLYANGLSASLRAGVAALPADSDGAFVFLGDMPRIPQAVLQPLADAVHGGAAAAATTFAGQRGHPVLFGRALLPRLAELDGDKGAGGLLARLGDQLVLIEAPDDGVLYDVDQRSDLK